ncbi:lipid binding protein, putative [Ricinus communis]|uniref:Lipid binding protein, putative n=1 Tax=Ricinus communis TaxID=3988 RepID=B9RZC4_RICCO|nr:lipid binding protein, putative [Ricinus communis]
MKIAIVALVLVLVLAIVVNGENPCRLTNEGIEACRPSVTGQNPAAPSDACCAALSKADLQCLCFYKNNYPWLLSSYKIDPNLAMQLPVKCKLVGESFHC